MCSNHAIHPTIIWRAQLENSLRATEIADILCHSDGLELENQTATHNRVRYLAKKGILNGGVKVDARGTLEFPRIEAYRAAIFCELMPLKMDVIKLARNISSAETELSIGQYPAPSQKLGEGSYSLGGLRNAIRGVSEGENWVLTISMPSHLGCNEISVEFSWSDKPSSGNEELEELYRSTRGRTRVLVDLTYLFRGIIPLVGDIGT